MFGASTTLLIFRSIATMQMAQACVRLLPPALVLVVLSPWQGFGVFCIWTAALLAADVSPVRVLAH